MVWRWPRPPRPSTVVICALCASMASTEQEYTALLSISTVHAPQVPRSQTRLAPVSSNWSRSASSKVTRGSSCALSFLPFTLSDTGTLPGPWTCGESSSASALTWLTSGTAAETPEIFRKSRRETPELDDDGLDFSCLSFVSCFAGFSGRSSTGCLHGLADQNDSKLRK